jgi:26S proteasome regulatory subunit N9
MSFITALRELAQINPEQLAHGIDHLVDLWERKHWYELGSGLCTLFRHPAATGSRIQIFHEAALHCFHVLDHFHFAEIVLATSEEYPNPVDAIDFLTNLCHQEPFDKPSEPTDLLNLRLVTLDTALGDFESALRRLLEIEARINEQTQLCVRSAFHRAQADLDLARGDLDSFYGDAFLYLSTARVTEDAGLAYELCRAGLLAERVCSFGELASHEILNSLVKTEHSWLRDLIMMLDKGESPSVDEFEHVFVPIIEASEVFGPHLQEIREKLALAVFLQLIFERDFHSRVLSFQEIASRCHIAIDQVEYLVLKALSTEIIRGIVDEVDCLYRT